MARKKFSFPWRGNNDFSLLVNGDEYYPDILLEIKNASRNIYIIQYLVSSGHTTTEIVNALIDAAKRNVAIFLIFDAYGAKELSITDRNRLLHAKVNLHIFNPFQLNHIYKFLYRDHRKLILIDDRIAYTGGAGFADSFDTRLDPEYGWQDIMIKMRGDIIADWYQLFSTSWHKDNTVPLLPLREGENKDLIEMARINIAYRGTHEVVRSVVQHMQRASHRIYIITPYFVTTWKIRRKMRKAAQRGIDVRLFVPGPHSDHPWINHISRRFYARLLNNGIRIYEYQPRFLHTKLVICDNWINAGSCNLDRWNMRFNHDANIEIQNSNLIEKIDSYIENLLLQSEEIDAEQWHKRPFRIVIREWFWSKVALWIERLSQSTRY